MGTPSEREESPLEFCALLPSPRLGSIRTHAFTRAGTFTHSHTHTCVAEEAEERAICGQKSGGSNEERAGQSRAIGNPFDWSG